MTIAAYAWGVETVWTASSVSLVVDRCCVDGDVSLSSGVECVCALHTKGSRMALIEFVCGVSVSVLSVVLIMVLSLEVGDVKDAISYI